MRPILFLLGIWHGLLSIAGILWSLSWVVEAIAGRIRFEGGFAFDILLVLSLGMVSILALALAAQGTKGSKFGGFLLLAPYVCAILIWLAPGAFGHTRDAAAWAGFISFLLLPGAIVGLYALFADRK